MKLKVVNAFSSKSGKDKVIWLAGGYAFYLGGGAQEIFESLDEAIARCAGGMVQDLDLLKAWEGGYDLPADEDHNWPKVFRQDPEDK